MPVLFALTLLPDATRAQSAPGGTETVWNSTGSDEADALRGGPSFGDLSGRKGRDHVQASPDSTNAGRKSPGWALSYSLGSTVLLAPLFGTGLVVGPAVGHFYAGNSGQAWTGIGIRSGAYLTAGVGWGLVWGSIQPEIEEEPPFDPSPPLGERARTVGIVLVGAGIAALLGSGFYDIATVPGAAKDYNQNRTARAQVAPTAGPQRGQVGLSLRLRF